MNELREIAAKLQGEGSILLWKISETAYSEYIDVDAMIELSKNTADARRSVIAAAENSSNPDGYSCDDFTVAEYEGDFGRIYIAARYRKTT